jgi:site-specific recombinase XerD
MTVGPWDITSDMFLSEEELDRLLASLRTPEACSEAGHRSLDPARAAVVDRVIIEGLVFSGLRNSEFCGLRVEDTVVATGDSSFAVVGTPRQDRTVHIPHSVSELIRRYVRNVRPGLLPEGTDPDDLEQPLVINERGRAYERTGLYRRVVRILTEAGLGPRASVQLLRHTYGYLAYKRTGCNLLFVQRQLGHAHPMVTAIYAQFVEEDYQQLADVVGGAGAADTERKSKAARRGSAVGGRRSRRR